MRGEGNQRGRTVGDDSFPAPHHHLVAIPTPQPEAPKGAWKGLAAGLG